MMFIYLVFSFVFNPNMKFKTFTPRCNIVCEDEINNSLIPPSGGELKLLTHLNAENWAYNWIMMISSEETPNYDEHFYINLFAMRGMANMYTSSKYFYIGYFPNGKICKDGPKYIGLFELNHSKRLMNAKILIENPHYIDDVSCLTKFRDSIFVLTNTSQVSLNFQELNKPGQNRYYYSWLYI